MNRSTEGPQILGKLEEYTISWIQPVLMYYLQQQRWHRCNLVRLKFFLNHGMSKNATSRIVGDQIRNQVSESFQLMRSHLLSMSLTNSYIWNYEIFRGANIMNSYIWNYDIFSGFFRGANISSLRLAYFEYASQVLLFPWRLIWGKHLSHLDS
jgi:hypothetical protein